MNTKICTKCGEEKGEAEYSWSIKNVKRHSSCKSCRASERMEYYQQNKGKELKYKANRQKKEREVARRFVFEYLTSHPCVDCGESDPLVLTFDHVSGRKKMNISQMVNRGYSLDALQKEIDKCEVRCGNCHLRIEKQRRGTIYY